ncbi:MAG: UrcA family protein [Devosia sp.]
MTSHTIVAAFAACCLVVPISAHAQDTTVAVRHTDLDLAVPSDVSRLDRRIMRAATEACGTPSTSDLVGMNHIGECVNASILATRRQRDQLVARSGQPMPIAVR